MACAHFHAHVLWQYDEDPLCGCFVVASSPLPLRPPTKGFHRDGVEEAKVLGHPDGQYSLAEGTTRLPLEGDPQPVAFNRFAMSRKGSEVPEISGDAVGRPTLYCIFPSVLPP